MYVVVYLAPGDYHRYHSPASFTATYRRHVAGYLEPVDPRYLKTHRDVFKSNERVNVLGDWAYGFFAMSFVGATNVGSIKLHFDDTLKSNIPKPISPYLQDRNYTTLGGSGDETLFWKYP
jgi:phosphatidylserine decarboxylase